jgi:hypothetical protein
MDKQFGMTLLNQLLLQAVGAASLQFSGSQYALRLCLLCGAGGRRLPTEYTAAYLGLLYQFRFLVPPFIFRRAPRQRTRKTSISERWNYGREMSDQFSLQLRFHGNCRVL